MKTLTRTIVVLIALNLITAGFVLAQPAATSAAPASTQSPAILSDMEGAEADALLRTVSLSKPRRLGGTGTGTTVLVIPSQEIKAEEILKINEDMNVMSRIFDGKLNQERLAATNATWSLSGGRWSSDPYARYLGRDDNIESMYLQGYGALFLMNVDFPLSAPPNIEKKEEEKTEKEDIDQVWEQTRQQMYEPQQLNQARRRVGATRPEVKYDAGKVENLKTSMIQMLKHAANIRILKPDESVILSITGSGISDSVILSMQQLPETDQTLVVEESAGQKITRVYKGGIPEDAKLSSPTVLLIRAKRSDIDSFAKGDLNFDKFREKVQILSYPLFGGSIAGTTSSVTETRTTGIEMR